MGIRRKSIRALVNKILKEHSVYEAPVDVEAIASSMGIKVRREPGQDDLSGFLAKSIGSNEVIIGVNGSHPRTRQRFTIAHELGHLHLHALGKIHIDHNSQVTIQNYRNKESSAGISLEEQEANLFAAELLMPADFLWKDLAELGTLDLLDGDQLNTLVKQYEVSNQALTIRLAYLKYISL